MDKKVYVTQPSLPSLKDYIPYLENIWESKWLTNNGRYHNQLEESLCEYLGVEHVALFSNGTAALMAALRVLDLRGEVITTPFTFVATPHALVWNSLTPVFVDIDPETCNIDPKNIEAAITPNTSAILPVHVYGRPCDVKAIDKVAKDNDLRVLYDAAPAGRDR